MRNFKLLAFLSFLNILALAQTSKIVGTVVDEFNNPVPFANISIDSSRLGASSNLEGRYEITDVPAGIYTIRCSFIGYQTELKTEQMISSAKVNTINFSLKESTDQLNEVVVVASAFEKPEESPVSVRAIAATEIYRNPGGNRDISKVVQVLPGVATSVSFRNDLIVRGGAPSENRFFLDGIEVTNINHFATQGSSGGPVGMINVNFIEEVDFYSSAFPIGKGNALSAVLDFKQKSGNPNELSGTFMLGSSDVGLTLDGPLGKNSTFLLSARRSYLQFLFQALKLPFLPTYNDFQYKQETKINDKNTLTLIGLGAIDDFALNQSVNDGVEDPETLERNNYILGNLPVNTQWNYTVGAKWRHFEDRSFQDFIFSRSALQNNSEKYFGNIESPENRLLDYSSTEVENKFRFEHNQRIDGWKLQAGIGVQQGLYSNETFSKVLIGDTVISSSYNSDLELIKGALFASASKGLLNKRLQLSLGLRTDFNSFNKQMSNPLKQISPRLSASYAIQDNWSVDASVGRYFQLPSYTALGFRNANGELLNQDLTYIQSNHYVLGTSYSPTTFSQLSLEGFVKQYAKYPFSLRDSISIANLGADFGVIGTEPLSSTNNGFAYGLEFLAQQKLSKRIYGILSYTWVRSLFEDKDGKLAPAAWDNRHLLNITAGRKFKNNWEIGAKFRFAGGSPYTPYDRDLSAQKEVWDSRAQAVFNWDLLNTERTSANHGLDIRVDKKWFFSNWTLNAYVDVENVYGYQVELQPFLTVVRDQNGDLVSDPNNSDQYLLKEIENSSGTLLPSVGLMIEF